MKTKLYFLNLFKIEIQTVLNEQCFGFKKHTFFFKKQLRKVVHVM